MEKDEILNLFLYNKIISKRGKSLIKTRNWRDIYNKIYDDNKSLIDSWFQSFNSVEEGWYCLLKDTMPDDHCCIICGNKVMFSINKNGGGYSRYCSSNCRLKGSKLKSEQTCIDKYGVKYSFQSENNILKSKSTCLERYGVDSYTKTKDYKEKVISTCLKKYGVENPAQSANIQNKIKETNIKNLGVYCSLSSTKVKEKSKDTLIQKYGVDNPMKSEDIKRKVNQSILKKYGVEHYSQTDEFKEKCKQTSIAKYGVEHYSQTNESKERYKQTCIDKYGVENVFQSIDIKNKAIRTCLDKYGVSHPFQSDTIKNKYYQTCLNKYGVRHPMLNNYIHKKVLSYKNKSAPEKKLEEFLINRGFNYQYEYECNGKNFDFAIFNENNELSILIEIDGEYFHGLLNDYDNKHVHGDKDCERFSKVPEGVKFVVCDSSRIEDCIEEILRVNKINYSEWINDIINSLPDNFPYPQYSAKRLENDYKKLCNYVNINRNGRLADSTIRQFHKSIWSAHVGNFPSPVEAWQDKDLLEKCVKNRFIYSSSLSSQAIVNGFNVCKLAPKVSVFSASLAKYLIQKYLSEYDTIFDPFSGFSGRMLGTCACGKHYVGQDINCDHVKESNEIIKFHNLDANVSHKDIMESRGSYDCLFTCPPYDIKESWNNGHQVNKSCDEWIDECLNRFSCKRYVFVVDETCKYKHYIVESINNISHFNNNEEYVLCI